MKSLVLVLSLLGASSFADVVSVSSLPKPILDQLATSSASCTEPKYLDEYKMKAQVERLEGDNTFYLVPCAVGAHNPEYLAFVKKKDFNDYELVNFAAWSETAGGLQGRASLLGTASFNPLTNKLELSAGGGGVITHSYDVVSKEYEFATRITRITLQEPGDAAPRVLFQIK